MQTDFGKRCASNLNRAMMRQVLDHAQRSADALDEMALVATPSERNKFRKDALIFRDLAISLGDMMEDMG